MDLRLLSNYISSTIIKYRLYMIAVFSQVFLLSICVAIFLSILSYTTVIVISLLYGIIVSILMKRNEKIEK